MTIRPFDWRDLILLHRIRNRGVCLDSSLMYTRGTSALKYTPLGTHLRGGNACTLVSRAENPNELSAVGQFSVPDDNLPARLVFISPRGFFSTVEGSRLLEAMIRMAGERGAPTLIADIGEHDPDFEGLHNAGFAIYSRQQILQLKGEAKGKTPPLKDVWHPASDRDYIAIQNLYTNLVPALVQQVEPPPSRYGRGLVYWSQNELLGYLALEQGPRGVWIQPYFHPSVKLGDGVLMGAILNVSYGPKRPLYVCVRSYQGWLASSLRHLGFESFSTQAVMVKRLAAPVRRPVRSEIPALNGTQPEPSAPFINVVQHASTSKRPNNL